MGSVQHFEEEINELAKNVHRLSYQMTITKDCVTVHYGLESSFVAEDKQKKNSDPIMFQLKGQVHLKQFKSISQEGDGVLFHYCQLCAPKMNILKQLILQKSYDLLYSIHSRATKM